MGFLEVVLAGVANVEDVCDAQSRDHLPILRMLPLAQVHLFSEHFIAELFGNRPISSLDL